MKYAEILANDVINGDGLRITLFISGCSLHCPNCHNKDLQDKNYGQEFTDKTTDQIINDLSPKYIDGLTLTGGHPLEPYNIGSCTELCKKIKAIYPNKSIWLYTGYIYENIKDYEILNYIDVLVDGSYIESLHDRTLKWRGSSNQRVIDIPKTKASNQIVLYCE